MDGVMHYQSSNSMGWNRRAFLLGFARDEPFTGLTAGATVSNDDFSMQRDNLAGGIRTGSGSQKILRFRGLSIASISYLDLLLYFRQFSFEF